MALYLPLTNALVLEVPRTGSKWLRAALVVAGVPHSQVGPSEWRGHGDLSVHGRRYRFIACFVREPASWYGSYWARRIRNGWRSRFTLDRRCQSDSFPTFIRLAVTRLPGFVSQMFERYTGPPEDPISFVGKQETLADDLVQALRLAGENFDEVKIRALPKINSSDQKPIVAQDLSELISLSEFEAMKRFGYLAGRPDPLRLQDLDRRYPRQASTLRTLAIWTASSHWAVDDRRAGGGVAEGTRHARVLTNFGIYVENVIGDTEMAEELYRQAVSADPSHPRTLNTLAVFLQDRRHDVNGADELFRRALASRPGHPETLRNYAVFMSTVWNDQDRAERLYRAATAADPTHAQNLGNFAVFMHTVRKDYEEAEQLYRLALQRDPGDAGILGNFAVFMTDVRQSHDQAEALFRSALEADARHPKNLRNFAVFMDGRHA